MKLGESKEKKKPKIEKGKRKGKRYWEIGKGRRRS